MNKERTNQLCAKVLDQTQVLYLDAHGELHGSDHICELIKEVTSKDHTIGDSKCTGYFTGMVIVSDL